MMNNIITKISQELGNILEEKGDTKDEQVNKKIETKRNKDEKDDNGKEDNCDENACKKATDSTEKERQQDSNNESYSLIENHGVIGNMKTLALVTTCGTIDWFCFPHFDSPSVFGALLDSKIGGSFEIYPSKSEKVHHAKQFYNAWTNILMTRFYTPEGLAQICDYMPVHSDKEKREKMNFISRKVCCLSGNVKFYFKCDPAFNYAKDKHKVTLKSKNNVIFKSQSLTMQLVTTLSIHQSDIIKAKPEENTKRELHKKSKHIFKEFEIKEGESVIFYFAPVDANHDGHDKVQDDDSDSKVIKSFFTLANQHTLLDDTRNFWLKWISKCTYKGRWAEMVNRSALVLKLLTFEKTGAIVAAGTTSLPEDLGGHRNWDYRYMWIRDAAFTLYAFMRIGFTEEAEQFMNFLEKIMMKLDTMTEEDMKEHGPLQIMYKIDGGSELTEETLDHFDGYKSSRPVRIGNGAATQLQLDIYGELMDSVYLYNKYAAPVTYDLWTRIRKITEWVCDNWSRKDEGIWEVRAERQHFVYSKVMCWVAIDRSLRLAERRSFPAPRAKWSQVRDDIYEDILKNGWNEEKKHFTMFYGCDTLDASSMIMPLVFFMSPNDPRLIDTLNAILKSPSEGGLVKNSLVYRYDPSKSDDGLKSEEGTFNICSFWLIEALTRVGRHYPDKMKEAHTKFDEAMSYANHLGLYSEEISVSGKHVGNFPQAFSHIALISCAYNLDRDLKI